MSNAYANAKTYVDRGAVSTEFEMSNGMKHSVEKPFDIAFVRGGTFRFEYRDDSDVYLVWSDGTSTFTQWTKQPGIKSVADVSLAIAGATGVSGGSAHTTPRLAGVTTHGFSIADLAELRFEGTELVDNHQCWKISGAQRSTRLVLWIDQQSKLLRKTFDQKELSSGTKVQQTTVYDPVIGAPVSPDLLKPPS